MSLKLYLNLILSVYTILVLHCCALYITKMRTQEPIREQKEYHSLHNRSNDDAPLYVAQLDVSNAL